MSTLNLTIHESRDFQADLRAFQDRDSKWYSKFKDSQPIYRLPMAIINALRIRNVSKSNEPFFDASSTQAEIAFTKFCNNHQTLGVWNGNRIDYPWLTPLANPTADKVSNIPWLKDPRLAKEINSVMDRLEHSRERMKGIAGWLMTDQQFLGQLRKLKRKHEAIDRSSRPIFPLQRSVVHLPTADSDGNASNFLVSFQAFCNSYGLAKLVTWDLPEPQGPFFSDPLPANTPARPEKGLYLFIPIAYPVTGNDDLLSMISQKQVELAQNYEVDERLAKIRAHRSFSKAFEIDFLEKAIRSRFMQEPWGLVSVIQASVSEAIQQKESHVKQLRTEIAARKNGRPKNVRVLK